MAFFQGDDLERPKKSLKILVIGAGIAGMYAGYLADQLGYHVQILEATDHYGGRIRALDQFADFPIELGAEEVHGSNSIWFEMLQHHGIEFVVDDGEALYYLNNQLLPKKKLMHDEDFRLALEFANNIWKYTEKEDITLAEYAKKKGMKVSYLHIVESLLENTYGAPLYKIGTKSTSDFDNNWSAGERNYILKNTSYLQIIEKEFQQILSKVQLNTAVKKIEYNQNNVKVSTINRGSFEADKVIITVPLSILKESYITFSPMLPEQKIKAIQTIGMDAGMKIILKFKEKFWDSSTAIIYGGKFAQQYWMPGYGKSQKNNIITALISGDRAKMMSHQAEKAPQFLLKDLDEMYHHQASEKFEIAHITDWYKEPFIQGLYSFPAPNSEAYREILAQPVHDKLFFAGEATNNFGHFATVHGAMETAYRAVHEITQTTNSPSQV